MSSAARWGVLKLKRKMMEAEEAEEAVDGGRVVFDCVVRR